jgi:dipeptidyl aminopeptidase/acylaminoacyl peptidase
MLSFSGDGSKLLYTATLTRGNIAVADFDPETLNLTSSPEPLIQGNRRMRQVDISSDGQRLVYRSGGARQDLFVSDIDGTDEQQITDDDAKDWDPEWSPDGSRITYYSDRSGTYEVWTIDPDGTGPMQLTDLPEVNPLAPIWSPDGLRIMFSARTHPVHIIDASLRFDEQIWDELPRVNPQRDDLGFIATDWRDQSPPIVGKYEELRVYDPDTREFTVISEEDAVDAGWMADGRRILFRVPGRHGFFVADVRNPGGDPLHIDVAANELVLSPDNRRVYLVREVSDSDVWMLELGDQ